MVIVNKIHNRIHISFDTIIANAHIKIYDFISHKKLRDIKVFDTNHEIIEISKEYQRLKIIIKSEAYKYVKIVS